MNCPRGRRSATKKCSHHEIFIMKIYIHVIFSNFTKILNHENLELYGMGIIHIASGPNTYKRYKSMEEVHPGPHSNACNFCCFFYLFYQSHLSFLGL